MTLEEYIARLKSLRQGVADLRAQLFRQGVDGAPVNMQAYGGDLVAIYATLTEMVKDAGGIHGEPPADAPQGLEEPSFATTGRAGLLACCRERERVRERAGLVKRSSDSGR